MPTGFTIDVSDAAFTPDQPVRIGWLAIGTAAKVGAIDAQLAQVDALVRAAGAGQADPANLAPILERLGLSASKLPDVASGFAQQFHSAVGRVDSMTQFASRLGRRWVAGVRPAATAFTQ